MEKQKRWVTPAIERKAFEDIITTTFKRYRDNLMCSDAIMDEIIIQVSKSIREQLQGLSRENAQP